MRTYRLLLVELESRQRQDSGRLAENLRELACCRHPVETPGTLHATLLMVQSWCKSCTCLAGLLQEQVVEQAGQKRLQGFVWDLIDG